MKPDWNDAPEEARYLAQDDDGEWHWFEAMPTYHPAVGEWHTGFGMMKQRAYERGGSTLEGRP